MSCFISLMLWGAPRIHSAPAGYVVFFVPADEENMATVFEDSAAGTVDDLMLINGYLDMDYDLNATTPDAGDDGYLLGYDIIDGAVDIDDDGFITTADDGTLGAYNVYNARIDINGSGAADGTDDGVFLTEPMRSIIGVTAWTDGTQIYIDHWEDGYDMDLNNPDVTADEILPVMNSGDQRSLTSLNVPSRLAQRSDPSDASPTDCKCINGTPGVTPEPGCYYDGKDKIYAVGGTITVTRAMVPESVTQNGGGTPYHPANVEAVSWEVYPVKPQLTTYILPFGENLGAGFEIVHALLQATEDNTAIQIDFNNDGVFDAIDRNRDGDCADLTDANAGNGYTITLNQGESMLLDRNSDGNDGAGSTVPNSLLNTGTLIKGSQTLQVQYTVGDPAVDWEIRNYSAFPRGLWDDEYYAPVPGMTNGAGTDIYLHNAWNTPITVNYEHRFGSGSIVIPANSTVSYYTATGNTEVPNNTAVHFKSADGRVFWGVSAADRNTRDYDWSYSLVPAYLLSNEYFIGWAPSNSTIPPTGGDINANGIFLTPAQDNTQVYVDYDRNGTVDSTYTLNRLQTIFLCDNDNDAGSGTAGNTAPQNDADMSGAAIWATGPFIAAYGQNSDNTTNTAGFDLGYTTLPDADWLTFVLDVNKSTDPAVHGTGTGEIAKYTIVVNTSEFDVDNITVTDTLAAGWSLCNASSTPSCADPVITFPDGSTGNANPAVSGQDLTWNSGNMGDVDMAPDQTLTIVYYIYTNAAHTSGSITTSPVVASGDRIVGSPAVVQTFKATDRVYNMYTDNDMSIEKWSKTAGNCGSDIGNDVDILYPGDSFCYRIKVTNTGIGTLTRIGVFDTLPAGVTYTASSTSNSHSTVADDFSTALYTNNQGTRIWGGNWIETGDDGTPTGDDILIANGELRLNNDDALASSVLYRQVDLSGATSAVLSFKWRTTAQVDAADRILVQARASNASTWTTLTGGDFTGIAGAQSGAYSVDLAAEGLGALTATAQIRFNFSANTYYTDTAANESFLVDDLSITYNISDTNGSPPNLIPGNYLYALLPGQSLAVSFSVTVNDPLATGTTELTNTAAVTSTQIPIPKVTSVTDPVVIPSSASGTAGDRVWLDTNGDGVLNVGETGIAGVTVTLKDQYGTALLSTTTDSQGRYQFTGVSYGSGYYVEVTAGLPAGLVQTTDGRTDNRTNAFGLITAGDYRDNFGTVSYVNSDGGFDWTTDMWIESDAGAAGGAGAGEIQVTGGQLRINADTGGTNNYIRRSLNIPDGATSATLTFDYSTATVEGIDEIVVEVATDGGNTFTNLATYTGATSGSANIDLTGYLSLDTRIRFKINAGYAEADDYFYVDNFRIQYSGMTDYADADLGYEPGGGPVTTAIIGDRVWSDADGDGVQDAGEPGLDGVEVRLYPDANDDGAPDYTTLTVIDGSIDLDGDGVITTADKGYAGNRSIIWGKVDANGDGAITTSDDGTISIGAATYNVYDGGVDFDNDAGVDGDDDGVTPAGLNYRTATTAAGGSYTFSVVATGTESYYVSIDSAQSALSAYDLTTASSYNYVNVAAGGIYLTADFGAEQKNPETTYAINDRIWLDADGDGIQDAGEAGISGVTIVLLNASGVTIATATTDANGDVAFTGVPEGVRYRWRVTDQNNVLANYYGTTTYALAGEFQMLDALDETDDEADGSDDDVVSYTGAPHFGYNLNRSIGDTVFNDLNGDGGQDTGESGLSGVVVKLYNDTDGDGVIDSGVDLVLATQTTDANGKYLFSGLSDGDYIVSIESPPAGYAYVAVGQPADSDGVKTGEQRAASVSGGVSDLDNDFAYEAGAPRAITGTIWDDADEEGDIDGTESGLSGVTVELYEDTNGNGSIDSGEPLIGTATTNASGVYTFSGIQGSGSEDYIVRATDENSILSGYTTTYEGPNTDGTGDDGVYDGEQTVTDLDGDVTGNYGYYKEPAPTRAVIGEFGAFNEGGRVAVRWRTLSEDGTLGFFLQRLDEQTGDYVTVNRKLLPGLLHAPAGGAYSYADNGAKADQYYTYRLEEVEAGGRRITYGPWRVFTGAVLSGGNAMGTLASVPSIPGYKRLEQAVPRATIARRSAGMMARLGAQAQQLTRRGALAKLYVDEDGLYFVSAQDIARVLGIGVEQVRQHIKANNVRMSCMAQFVAVSPVADNRGIYFYGVRHVTPYSDENVYWLAVGKGLRMREINRAPKYPAGDGQYFHEQAWAEEDVYPLLFAFTDPNEDFWMWDYVFPGYGRDHVTLPLPSPGLLNTDAATLTVTLQGASETFDKGNDHQAAIRVNGTDVGNTQWDGLNASVISVPVPPGVLQDSGNQVDIAGIKVNGVPYNIFYVNCLQLDYPRRYAAVDDRLTFENNGYQTIGVDGFTKTNIRLFDVTDPFRPALLTGSAVEPSKNGDGTFHVRFAAGAAAGRYFALTPDKSKSGALIADRRSNLKNRDNRGDYLIITTGDMMATAKILADYRASTGRISMVVDIEDIYDEFANGLKDPDTIRDFLGYAHAVWRIPPKYVLLAGDGSFDYKDNKGFGDSVIPALLTGIPGDGLRVTDNLYADVTGDLVPDMAIGRIPAINADELLVYINKAMGYEAAVGSWTSQALLAADAPDAGGEFPLDSEDVAALFPDDYLLDRLYLDAIPIAEARARLVAAINAGRGYVNFLGHGSMFQIGNKNLFSTGDLAKLNNAGMLPVITAMTCVAGDFGYPGYDGLSESLVLKAGGGAAAMWAPTGFGYNARSVELSKGFYSAVFIGGERILGDAIRRSKEGYAAQGKDLYYLNLYNLMGDPALRIK